MTTHENGTSNGTSSLFRAGAHSPLGGRFALFEPPPVDAVGVEERAAALGKRSLKKAAKVAGLKLAISMMDLTTLEGKDTPGKVRQMCQKALRPLATDSSVGPCGAVCVYPNLVPVAKEVLRGSTVKVASVATAFPSGQSPLPVKIDDTKRAVDFGADEIDMVIDRGAMLTGDYGKVFDEIAAIKEACGEAHLKVILETGELGSYDVVRKASELAIAAGGDFIKTSTGKIQPAATPAVTLVMLEAIRDHFYATGRKIG
ncbi:MAG TPA: deoxyribose-phosphate aldolase, partial [Labilithrix sp.]|nr:deoxyribose-phosphate aldolase [Labilithrix sp.]